MKRQGVLFNPPECCPKFNPAPWDGKIFKWENKKFIKDRVFTLFYIPLNFGAAMTRIIKKVREGKAKFVDSMCLSDHTSMWNMNLYLAVNKHIEGAENREISGTFFTKVYEGELKEAGKWGKDFEAYAKSKGYTIKNWYMWYTTCPACAKKYGKNYIVIVGKI